MAKTFTKLGREITIAAKEGGPDPDTNPRLRVLIQTSKKENMPKENVERAIKRATDRDASDYKEVRYEGYGPHGVAVLVETATDNTTRTVANVRSYFNKHGGSLGTTGSVEFLFEHKCIFHILKKEGTDLDELLLELIDYGVDEVEEDGEEIIISGEFSSNGAIQSFLEESGYEITSSELVWLPLNTKSLSAEEREDMDALLEKLEDDDDVQNVFHTMVEDSDDE